MLLPLGNSTIKSASQRKNQQSFSPPCPMAPTSFERLGHRVSAAQPPIHFPSPSPFPPLNCQVAARCRLGRAATSQFRGGKGEGRPPQPPKSAGTRPPHKARSPLPGRPKELDSDGDSQPAAESVVGVVSVVGTRSPGLAARPPAAVQHLHGDREM